MIKPGDMVQYCGRGCSVLDYGPGRVMSITTTMARVKVTAGGDVCGNKIRSGQVFAFSLDRLERADPTPQETNR